MAYLISNAEATELLKIARTVVAKRVQAGLIKGDEAEDYAQDLVLLMIKHQDDWSVPEGVSLYAYAYVVMDKRIISLWRFRNSQNDKVLTDATSVNEYFANDDGDEEEELVTLLTSAGVIQSENDAIISKRDRDVVDAVRRFVLTLPEDEQKICEMLMHCVSKTAISLELGIHRQTLYRKIDNIRNEMIDNGFEQYSKNL